MYKHGGYIQIQKQQYTSKQDAQASNVHRRASKHAGRQASKVAGMQAECASQAHSPTDSTQTRFETKATQKQADSTTTNYRVTGLLHKKLQLAGGFH